MWFYLLKWHWRRNRHEIKGGLLNCNAMNMIAMESVEMCEQFDVRAFLKRRGTMVAIGMVVLIVIIMIQLWLR